MRAFLLRILASGALSCAAGTVPAQQVPYDAPSPILATRCSMCHGGASAAADLRLDSLQGLLKGSRNGPVVRAGELADSELIRRLKGTAQPRMPMTGPPFLSDVEIASIVRCIDAGAPDAAGTAAPRPTGARVRLHGTLQADGRLDELNLHTPAQARADRRAGAGAYVEVRGRVGDDGAVIVERIRSR